MAKAFLAISLTLFLAACSSGGGGGGGSTAATTYSITGTVDTGQTASSFSTPKEDVDLSKIDFTLSARTQCSDDKYYSVFCMSYTTPPVAAEGDVDCTNGGAFTVDGLPLNEPIYCVVRRFENATSTDGSNIGSIEIPAANLNGGTDTIVGAGDLTMAVTLNSDGSITADVQGDQGTQDTSAVDAAYTAANINGEWALTCDSDNGGTQFSAGHCKCFLGEQYFGAAGYSSEDDCMNDANGPGAAITQTVSMGIGMYIYEATAQSDIGHGNGQTIASGTDLKAISIWSTTGSAGSYVSNKGAGGEGVTNLGGSLSWGTSPLDPTTAISWHTGTITVADGTATDRTFNVPALANPNTMTHSDWMTWIGTLVANAEAASFSCNFGPNDANAHSSQAGVNLANNIDCINQVLWGLEENRESSVPRLWVQPYCDNMGCLISNDAADSANPYYDANALNAARIEFEGWKLAYGSTWASADDNSAVAPEADGIGIAPVTRHVFEPLEMHASGAGFRQDHHYEEHYECVSGGAGPHQITNAACSGGGYYELVCHYSEELAIKFIGTSSPMDVIFDSIEAPVAARLHHHNGAAPQEVQPTGTDVFSMCASRRQGGGFTFMATATKQ